MSDNLDPLKLISILHVILRDLEEMLSQAPEPANEVIDNRAIRLRNQIDRLKSVLTKHKDAESRKRELAKQNRQNTRPRSGTKLSRGTAHEPTNESNHTGEIQNRIKREEHVRRQKALEKQNRENTKRR